MINVTFTEYQKFYTDIATEEKYIRLYNKSEYLLRGWTARRIDDVQSETDFRYEQVKTAIIHTTHSLVSPSYALGVVSVSNDGYSETYASAKEQEEILRDRIFDILSGTGLMGCM